MLEEDALHNYQPSCGRPTLLCSSKLSRAGELTTSNVCIIRIPLKSFTPCKGSSTDASVTTLLVLFSTGSSSWPSSSVSYARWDWIRGVLDVFQVLLDLLPIVSPPAGLEVVELSVTVGKILRPISLKNLGNKGKQQQMIPIVFSATANIPIRATL